VGFLVLLSLARNNLLVKCISFVKLSCERTPKASYASMDEDTHHNGVCCVHGIPIQLTGNANFDSGHLWTDNYTSTFDRRIYTPSSSSVYDVSVDAKLTEALGAARDPQGDLSR